MIKHASDITLKNLLNCYYKECNEYSLSLESEQIYKFIINLDTNTKFEVLVKLSPTLKSPTWELPCYLNKNGENFELESTNAINLINEKLNKLAGNNQHDILARISNSTNNIAKILQVRNQNIENSFSHKSNFISNEQNLIRGHRLQPDPKSREGFSEAEFIQYSPETNGKFKLHYLYVDKSIIETESLSSKSANQLILDFLAKENIMDKPDQNHELFILHPWQAAYLAKQAKIKEYKAQGKIVDIGTIGPWFYPTTSVRTVYSPEANIMLKFSLNIAITNSVRVNLAKECKRSISVHKLYEQHLRTILKKEFPWFNLITDPAYTALKINNKVFDPSICIIRNADFNPEDDIACVASLTEQNPFKEKTRISSLIQYMSVHNNSSLYEASVYWFETYLSIAIAPVLWLYCKYGIALEAHQQNLMIKLEEGLPIESFYRDSQGYYFIKDHEELSKANFGNISDLCEGSQEFVDHHFCYYFIVNQLISVIETIANTEYIEEIDLIKITISFFEGFEKKYSTCSRFIQKLLNQDTLPLKANLLTRLNGLDELQAPLTRQSIYVNTNNPFKENYENI